MEFAFGMSLIIGGGMIEVFSFGTATPIALPAWLVGGALMWDGFDNMYTAVHNLSHPDDIRQTVLWTQLANATDPNFANAALSWFGVTGMNAAMPRPAPVIPPSTRLAPDPNVIRVIKALPDNAKLSSLQIGELNKNIDVILTRTLPAKAASGRRSVQDVVDLFKNDSRFRFLDQIPGARAHINDALGKFGASLD